MTIGLSEVTINIKTIDVLSEVFINLVSVAYLKRTYLKVWSCTEHITSSVVISVYFVTRFAIIGTDQFMELLVYSNIQV